MSEQDATRRVPFDIEVEQALLGAIIADNTALERASRLLRPGHFYDPLHQRLFGAMVADYDCGRVVITPLTLHAQFKADPGLIEIGGIAYLANLAAAAPARPDVSDYALVTDYAYIVRSLAMRRKMIGVLEDAITCTYDAPRERSGAAALEETELALQAIRESEGDHFGDPLPLIDLAHWECHPPPERRWHVRDRVPARNVTLLSGEGAMGKTLLALHLAVATALGKEWLEIAPRQGPVLVICCEDDEDELHIRVTKIAEYYDVRLEGLIGKLHLVPLVARDTVLAVPDRNGVVRPTCLFQRLVSLVRKINPVLIVIDTSADVYAGDENNRAQVRQFIALLRRLAVETESVPAVVLTSHPSVRGTTSGEGFSGSTAWHASVRARLYMHRPKRGADDDPDPDERVLEVMKNNYGPAGETISLRWRNGLFVPTGPVSWIDRRAAESGADETFLRLLARYERQDRNVSHIAASPYYGPRIFAADPDANGISAKAFKPAMDRLFAADRIHIEQSGKPSRPCKRIVVGPAPKCEQHHGA